MLAWLIFADLFGHFLSSSLAGLLGFSLTWITSYSWWRIASRLRGTTLPKKVAGSYMLLLSILALLFLSLFAHYIWDYYLYDTIMNRPLGPPLQLDTGNLNG